MVKIYSEKRFLMCAAVAAAVIIITAPRSKISPPASDNQGTVATQQKMEKCSLQAVQKNSPDTVTTYIDGTGDYVAETIGNTGPTISLKMGASTDPEAPRTMSIFYSDQTANQSADNDGPVFMINLDAEHPERPYVDQQWLSDNSTSQQRDKVQKGLQSTLSSYRACLRNSGPIG